MRAPKGAGGRKARHGNDRKYGGRSKTTPSRSSSRKRQPPKQRAAVTEEVVNHAKEELDRDKRFGHQVFLPRVPKENAALEALDIFGDRADPLRDLARQMVHRQA